MNREISNGAPALYPLQGDVKSTAGSSIASVVGLQGITISTAAPNPGDTLVYINGEWTPFGAVASLFVNSVVVSQDLVIFVNGVSAIGSTLGISVNGTPI